MTESAMNTTLAQAEHDLATLSTDMTMEQVLDVMTRINFVIGEAKRFKDLLEKNLLEWCVANGDITAGSIRYYAGTKKTTKCVNIPAAVEALMDASAGDFGKFCTHLAANALKHGACKSSLSPGIYGQFFQVTEEAELEEGKPKKTLQKINTDFVK